MKPSLILLPGLLNDAALWEPVSGRLAEGAAPQVMSTAIADSVAALADSVLSAAPESFILAGLSMGGYVAMEIMRRAPQRVLGLMLVNTTARPDTQEARERRLAMMALARDGGFETVVERMLGALVHPDHAAGPVAEAFRAMASRVGAEGFLRQQAAILGRPDSRPDLGTIRCPTLVVGGAEDSIVPREALDEMAQGIAGAELAVVDHCGHLAPLERPEAAGEVLAGWIARHF